MPRRSLFPLFVLLAACNASPSSGDGGNQGADGSGSHDAALTGDGSGAACGTCFVHGDWQVDNLSPCFNTSSMVNDAGVFEVLNAVSTYLAGKQPICPTDPTTKPTQPWSTDDLTVDCAGQYQLCLTLKAGNDKAPLPSDCTVAQSCAAGDYAQGGKMQPWAPLPSWITGAGQLACANQVYDTGGYYEMSVSGTATGCGVVDKVFLRIPFCPLACLVDSQRPGCAPCQSAYSTGSF